MVDYVDRRFGTVEAEWLEDDDEWDADWSKCIEEDGDVQMGPTPSTCGVCQSPRIEEIDEGEVVENAKQPA
jgi:hypothetical protein